MDIETIDTGDILLFNGNYFISKIIEYFTGSKFSHCGIAIKNPDLGSETLNGIYVLESGSENNKTGVQLTKIDNILNNYKGELYIRKLKCTRDKNLNEKIIKIYETVKNLPYDIDPIDWIKAEFDIEIGNLQKQDTFWCSALVAYMYIKLDFLNSDIPWTIITPQDFSSNSHRLWFKNCILDNEMKLVKT